MTESRPDRIVVFGVTGHVGEELIGQLDAQPWARTELVGVGSPESEITEFEFRGEALDVEREWPTLRATDLVFVCTPPGTALDVVRQALRAQAACIDCSGVMYKQAEVPLPIRSDDWSAQHGLASAPLVSVASPATLVCAPIIEAFAETTPIRRLVGSVLQSASALGRSGLIALSEESIALFNQSEELDPGPAGQAVAFDVIPRGADETRLAFELERAFGAELRADLGCVRVPSFLGEGLALNLECEKPVTEEEFRKALSQPRAFRIVEEGLGTRGLVAVEGGESAGAAAAGPFDATAPTGPTLRDAGTAQEVLIGRVRADVSLAEGLGWRVWIAYEPSRVVAEQALRIAAQRFAKD